MALEIRPLKKGNMIMMQKKKEKDKQYEAKRVRSNIQSWLAGRSWLRYDKNSKKMFCDYCIKNGVTTKYHVKNSCNVSSCICYCYCQSMKLENIKVINISGVARNCRDEKSNAMHNFINKINIFTAKGGGVNADT